MTTSENAIDLQRKLDDLNEARRSEKTASAVKAAIATATDLGAPTDSAVLDIVRRAKRETELAGDGSIKLKTGQTVVEWLRTLKASAPHLFRAPAAAKPGSIAGMPRAEFDKLPARQRLELARRAGL